MPDNTIGTTPVADAIAQGLAAYDEQRERRQESERVSEAVSLLLRRVKDEYAGRRARTLGEAAEAVGAYCSDARSAVLETLGKDPRMPRSINYLERYNALRGMDDRGEVLRRLGQTLDLADKIICGCDAVDVDEALREAAEAYAARVLLLNGITVCEAEEQVEDETEGELGAVPAPDVGELDAVIEGSFLGAVEGLSEQELSGVAGAGDALDHVANVAASLRPAVEEARRAADTHAHARAAALEGRALRIPTARSFDGSVVVEAVNDPEQVGALSALVRRSFKTFSQVVRDNGLFSAFAHEGGFGMCSGWRYGHWIDDFLSGDVTYSGEVPGRSKVAEIPDTVEEDEGGDSIERACERMEEFNKRRYFGPLDDEFACHVDAFWYGFKKLMEAVNGLFRMNPSEFNRYCNRLADEAKRAVADLGAADMDEHQLKRFCEDVESLGRRADKADRG